MTASQGPTSTLVDAGAPPRSPGGFPAAPGAPSGLISAAALSGTRILSLFLTLFAGVLSAAYFGAGAAKDSYVAAQTLPSLLGTFTMSGLYSLLMVALAEVGQRDGVSGQFALIRRVLRQVCLVLVPVALAATVFPRFFMALIAPGFGPDQIELSSRLLPLAMFTMIFTVAFAVIRALFNVRHHFAVPGLINLLVGAVSLLTLVLLVRRTGIFALALGPLVGTGLAAGALGLAALLLLRKPRDFAAGPAARSGSGAPRLRFWNDFIPMTVGANFGQVNLAIDNAFASFLPAGNITQLGFASVILSNAEQLTIFSLAEVAFSRLAAASQRGVRALEEELHLNLRPMLLLTAPISAGCLAFGTPLARLLFERGEFGADDTLGVAGILACLAPEMLFMGYFALFWRVLAARRRTRAIVWTSVGAMALNSALDYVLMKSFGSRGIALATSGVTTTFTVILGLLVRREGVRLFAPGDGLYAIRVLASAAVMAGAVHGWTIVCSRQLELQTEASRFVETGGGLLLGALVYAGALHAAGIRVVPQALGRMARAAALWKRG